jgi:hypothetical protein
MLGVEVMLMYAVLMPFQLVIVGVWFIFIIWVLWMVVKSLKGIDSSLKDIARNGSTKL